LSRRKGLDVFIPEEFITKLQESANDATGVGVFNVVNKDALERLKNLEKKFTNIIEFISPDQASRLSDIFDQLREE